MSGDSERADRYGGWCKSPQPNMVTTITPLDTRGPKRLWSQGPGFVIRERGDVDGVVVQEYLCPAHGRFEARVPRRDMPDEVACHQLETEWSPPIGASRASIHLCGLTSPWSPSSFHAWKSSGEVTG